MGIISSLITKAVEDTIKYVALDTAETVVSGMEKGIDAIEKAADGVEKIVDATLGDKETRQSRKEQHYLSKDSAKHYLIIQKNDCSKDVFHIFEKDGEIKYYVQGKVTQRNLRISIFDRDRNVVGGSRKSAYTVRVPTLHENNPADYILEIKGEQIATLKTKFSLNKENYEIVPYKWIVRGDVLKWDYTVCSEEAVIAHISRRKGYERPTYIIDFINKENEEISLLIMLTIICRES